MAILFSSLLVWVQVVAAAAPSLPGQGASCCQCQCGLPECCVTGASGPTQPAPAVPQRSSAQSQIIVLALLGSFSLPLPDSSSEALRFSPSPVQGEAGPLYQRHCALLI